MPRDVVTRNSRNTNKRNYHWSVDTASTAGVVVQTRKVHKIVAMSTATDTAKRAGVSD